MIKYTHGEKNVGFNVIKYGTRYGFERAYSRQGYPLTSLPKCPFNLGRWTWKEILNRLEDVNGRAIYYRCYFCGSFPGTKGFRNITIWQFHYLGGGKWDFTLNQKYVRWVKSHNRLNDSVWGLRK